MTAEASASASLRIQREENSFARAAPRIGGRVLIYAALAIWTFIALFPLYWTLSTSFKLGRDVTQGHLVPWLDFVPSWKGWQSLGLSPDTIFTHSNVRDEFLDKFLNSVIASVGASALAVVIGSLAAYGLSRFEYKFGPWRNKDISFFFLSQLILPPVVLAMPFLILYKELALLDTRIGLILVYTLMVLPIVIWVDARPVRHDPERDGAGRAGRRLFDLGRLLPHRPADGAPRHGRGVHPCDGSVLE